MFDWQGRSLLKNFSVAAAVRWSGGHQITLQFNGLETECETTDGRLLLLDICRSHNHLQSDSFELPQQLNLQLTLTALSLKNPN